MFPPTTVRVYLYPLVILLFSILLIVIILFEIVKSLTTKSLDTIPVSLSVHSKLIVALSPSSKLFLLILLQTHLGPVVSTLLIFKLLLIILRD